MRRQGQYLHSDGYPAPQMQTQVMEQNSSHFQGQLEAFTPERDNSYLNSKIEARQGWEKDGFEPSNPMASRMFYEGRGNDASQPYYQAMRPDSRPASERQGNIDTRPQAHDKEKESGFDKLPSSQSFEGLEQKFLDDIAKLTKDLNNAEDAENARHREKISAINTQYQEQLSVLRARHATHRDEFLRRESSARQHQYQQALMEQYPNSGMGPRDPQGYGGIAGAPGFGDAPRPYAADRYDSYGERGRFHGGARDRFEPRGPYPGGRAYDIGSRYY